MNRIKAWIKREISAPFRRWLVEFRRKRLHNKAVKDGEKCQFTMGTFRGGKKYCVRFKHHNGYHREYNGQVF